MQRWVGKVALVTGASAGIGAVITEKLVESGVHVVGLARRSERIIEQSKRLSRKTGKLYAVKTDMSKESDILNAFDWTEKNLGPVHILVNNAGVVHQTNLIEGDTTAKWKETFDVNVLGLCIATREAVKKMRENQISGHIIHINSGLGHRVINFPKLNVYPASKYAVTALTETLRQELNRFNSKIKVTSISPGYVKTKSEAQENIKLVELEYLELKKMAGLESEDVANAVLYSLGTPAHVQVHEIMLQAVGAN